MKFAITGHTSGIGLAIKNLLESQGHCVLGFSRSNGFDISQEEDQKRIVEESQDCDVFINNAVHKFAQTDLLYKLHDQWQDQDRLIVNISSAVTMRWFKEHPDKKYRTYKKSLDEASDFLNNFSILPKIMLINPCATDTDRASYLEHKLSVESVADLIVYCILHPTIKISQLGFIRP
jgi:hypothetical protein